jgi:hypothetical protein
MLARIHEPNNGTAFLPKELPRISDESAWQSSKHLHFSLFASPYVLEQSSLAGRFCETLQIVLCVPKSSVKIVGST